MNVKLKPLQQVIGAAIVCGAATSSNVIADNVDYLLDEIVITAQKREQSLQDVPLSVSAVSGNELAARNENEISELAKIVPGFTFSDGISDADRNIQVRGVGTQTFSRGVDQSVGTVVDGVVSSSVAASLLDFTDVARVEVLRGPQGMLFGKNASAGVLNIATYNPTADVEWGAGFSYAEENEIKINGYVSGPLIGEELMGRLSFYSNRRDSMLENIHPGGEDYNDRDEWGLRGKLIYKPNKDMNVLLSVTHSERENQCCAAPAVELIPGGLAESLGVPAGKENTTILENDASINDITLDIYSAEVNYTLGEYTLTSITSFSESEFLDDFRGSGVPITVVPANTGLGDTRQITQELRITSPVGEAVDYVAGLYYFEKKEERTFFRLIDLSAMGVVPFPGFLTSLDSLAVAEMESLAAFGQVTWHMSDRARLSIGGRLNHEDVSIEQQVTFIPGTQPETAPGTRDANDTDDAISWRIIGEYDLVEDVMIYASVARGYKGPGVSTLASALDRPAIVAPEIPTNYEMGLKSEWWSNRLRVNASVFHTSFEDFQTSVVANPGSVPSQFFLSNAGELTTQGLEIETSARLSEHFNLSLALSYVDAEYVDYEGAPCYAGQTPEQGCVGGFQSLSGRETANSPDWSYTITGNYAVPLEDLPFDGFMRASYYWQDDVQYSSTNNPATIGDAYGIADLSIGVSADDGSYSVQIYAKNLFDEFYVSRLLATFNATGVAVSHSLPYTYQRRVGISAQLHF